MRSPLNSRTNNRPERVAPDEAFVFVAWTTVMVSPLPALAPQLGRFALPARVKPGKSRQISNETADRRLRLLARSHGPSRKRRFPGSTRVPFFVFWSAGRLANAPSGRPRTEAARRSRCRRRRARAPCAGYWSRGERVQCEGRGGSRPPG